VTGVPVAEDALRTFLVERVSLRLFLTCLRRVVGSMPIWTREAKADAVKFPKGLPSLLRIFVLRRGLLHNQQAKLHLCTSRLLALRLLSLW
jgi:hypothetical protein